MFRREIEHYFDIEKDDRMITRTELKTKYGTMLDSSLKDDDFEFLFN